MVEHTFHPSTLEAEAVGPQVWGLSKLHSKVLSQKKRLNINCKFCAYFSMFLEVDKLTTFPNDERKHKPLLHTNVTTDSRKDVLQEARQLPDSVAQLLGCSPSEFGS